ncbi:MAG TPA: ADOP family duplicated permease [Acidobacteriaceae bacterium]|jgi:predicted permease|nr:ADOP family duplicated permease [Acidobacteriaceae bacterium]
MDWLRTVTSRWLAVFRRAKIGREIDEELREHLAMATEENRQRRMSEEQARQKALRDFGGVTEVWETVRLREGWPWIEHLQRDVGYALRQMRRSPGFAAVVIGTLALGIGAAAAMFTVVDHVLLRPLPYREPGRLVVIKESGRADTNTKFGSQIPWLDIREWETRNHSFAAMSFAGDMWGRQYLEAGSATLPIHGVTVSSGLFPLLGSSPWLGHGFDASGGDTSGKNTGTVILSFPVWQAVFDADRNVIGRAVHINGNAYAVVGVMPRGFSWPVKDDSRVSQVWTAAQLGPDDQKRTYGSMSYSVVGRLKPGVTITAAQAEMAELQKSIAPEYSNAEIRETHTTVTLRGLASSLADQDLRKALLALLAAAGVLWLNAAVNATNLLLARGSARQREMAVRGALGAGRGRVMQQMMIEGLVLSSAAALAGIGLAVAGIKLAESARPIHLDLNLSTHLNGPILGVLCLLTLVTAMVAAAWPAWIAARAPIEPALRQGGQQAGTGRRHHRMRGVLVSVEIALSLTLLVGCGLLLRTIYTLRHVPLGYRTDHILVANLNLPAYRYQGQNLVQVLYQPLLERAQQLHGVQTAGLMSEVPLGQTFNIMLTLRMNGNELSATLNMVSPDIQKIFGFRMLAGRFYNGEDSPTSAPVVVVNPAFAREYAPDKHDPASVLGMTLWQLRKNAPMHIVGVMDNERQHSIEEASQPEVEICLCQLTPDANSYAPSTVAMDLALRTQEPTKQMIPELRAILKQAAPELETSNITTMDQILEDSYGSQGLAAHLLEIFGGAALLLCVAGLYGLLAYVVTQRTREMGVRIALGSPRGKLLWLILRQAGAMLIAGVIAGSALAWAASRLARGFLYGVKAHDGWTLAGAALLLLASGLAAAYLPARRAAGVDPMQALRAE